MNWESQKPDNPTGDYFFSGKCFFTDGISKEIPKKELEAILQDLRDRVSKSGGIDYLQVYKHKETGVVIWVIDQVTKTSLEDGSQPAEHNYCTILFPHEY